MELVGIIFVLVLIGLLMRAQYKIEVGEQETEDKYKRFDNTGRKRTP